LAWAPRKSECESFLGIIRDARVLSEQKSSPTRSRSIMFYSYRHWQHVQQQHVFRYLRRRISGKYRSLDRCSNRRSFVRVDRSVELLAAEVFRDYLLDLGDSRRSSCENNLMLLIPRARGEEPAHQANREDMGMGIYSNCGMIRYS
jgi:hypothetical protein